METFEVTFHSFEKKKAKFYEEFPKDTQYVDKMKIPDQVRINCYCYFHRFIAEYVKVDELSEPLSGPVRDLLSHLGEPPSKTKDYVAEH